MSASKAIFPS